MPELEILFTVAQIAERYHVSVRTVYRWIHNNRFESYLQLDDGQYRVHLSSLQSFELIRQKNRQKRKYIRKTEEERQHEQNRVKRKYTRKISHEDDCSGSS